MRYGGCPPRNHLTFVFQRGSTPSQHGHARASQPAPPPRITIIASSRGVLPPQERIRRSARGSNRHKKRFVRDQEGANPFADTTSACSTRCNPPTDGRHGKAPARRAEGK